MSIFVKNLEIELKKNADKTNASGQKAYMRHQFEFYGLKAAKRREIQKPFLIKGNLPEKSELEDIIKALWTKPQRDFHYVGQELVFKYIKQFEKKDIELLEFMVIHKSWWDTVDYIAANLVGAYFKIYPKEIKNTISKWLVSNNIWLQRSALLFQLKYKEELDTVLLSNIITHLLGSKEFFINKAIGWILREYSKTNPKWVLELTKRTNLDQLSKKEALRLIIKTE
ncbi:MAG: DNA alkylation repair protein [Aureibaculum sp.]